MRHPFLTLKGLVKRNLLHLAGGLGIGLAGGKKAVLPVAVIMGAKEATDPHPATDNKRWWLKSAIDWTVWTGGTILGASIRRKIGK